MKRILRRMMLGLGGLLGFALVSVAAIYALALVALNDLEQSPAAALPGGLSSSHSVAAGRDGRAQVWQRDTAVMNSSGHAAPIVSATLIGDGRALLTSGLDGSLRWTDVTASARLTSAVAPKLSAAAYDRLWKPYGAPVAQSALWLTAQVLPLHIPETRKGRRGRIFRDCPGCPEMVEIGPGITLMGSPLTEEGRDGDEGPRHLVTISQPFAAGRYAVTFAEWDACVADGGCGGYQPDDRGWGRGDRPVINVSWDDANAYGTWLSGKTGKSYRLLSEAEREYVARAGTATPFWWGSSITPEQANYYGNYTYAGGGAKGEYRQRTVPVKSFQPNPWGLYQVHGNVWEWTADCWNDSYASKPPELSNAGGEMTTGGCPRVLRGGAWVDNPRDLRAAGRNRFNPVDRGSLSGFRLARTLNP